MVHSLATVLNCVFWSIIRMQDRQVKVEQVEHSKKILKIQEQIKLTLAQVSRMPQIISLCLSFVYLGGVTGVRLGWGLAGLLSGDLWILGNSMSSCWCVFAFRCFPSKRKSNRLTMNTTRRWKSKSPGELDYAPRGLSSFAEEFYGVWHKIWQLDCNVTWTWLAVVSSTGAWHEYDDLNAVWLERDMSVTT